MESLGDPIPKARGMQGFAVNDAASRTAIDTDSPGRTERKQLIPALGRLVKPGGALDTKMSYFVFPRIDKPVTVASNDERSPVSR